MTQCTPKSFDLTGKVALITGASYGIGMAIAKAMAANGATIVFNDIKQELVDKGLAAYNKTLLFKANAAPFVARPKSESIPRPGVKSSTSATLSHSLEMNEMQSSIDGRGVSE